MARIIIAHPAYAGAGLCCPAGVKCV